MTLGALSVPLGPGVVLREAKATPLPAAAKDTQVRTGIEWAIDPGEVTVHLNGKRLGKAKDLKFTTAAAGRHVILLVRGGDEEELEVRVVKGQVLRVVYQFDE